MSINSSITIHRRPARSLCGAAVPTPYPRRWTSKAPRSSRENCRHSASVRSIQALSRRLSSRPAHLLLLRQWSVGNQTVSSGVICPHTPTINAGSPELGDRPFDRAQDWPVAATFPLPAYCSPPFQMTLTGLLRPISVPKLLLSAAARPAILSLQSIPALV